MMLLFFLTLLFSVLCSSCYAYTPPECSKCGTFYVPLPLSTTPTCGNPNYSLHCTNGTLHFPSAGNLLYKVLSIDPASQTLILEPPVIDPTTCHSSDLLSNGFRIDNASPFNISKRNTVMLFNCNEGILLSPLNCSSTSPCRAFEERVEGCRRRLCCSYLKDSAMTSRRIRIRLGGCSAYTSVVNFEPKDGMDAWHFGIELQWLPVD